MVCGELAAVQRPDLAPAPGPFGTPAVDPGEALFEAFHDRPADRVERRIVSRVIPPVVVRLGTLRGLIYRSDKWTPGVERSFIHFMEDPPLLVCDPGGRQLYIVGGSYRVTSRGIEG